MLCVTPDTWPGLTSIQALQLEQRTYINSADVSAASPPLWHVLLTVKTGTLREVAGEIKPG